MSFQAFLPGFPEGATVLAPGVYMLLKEGVVTYFVNGDNYFHHKVTDKASQRFVLASLMNNGHVRPCDLERSPLGFSHRTLMNWLHQLRTRDAGSFFRPARRRGGTVMTQEVVAHCEHLLSIGQRVPSVAREAGVAESTLRKAIARGAVRFPSPDILEGNACSTAQRASTKSERSHTDSQAAQGMGTACTRTNERMQAAVGLAEGVATRFERCDDVMYGGLLAGLPALCENGLLSGLDKYFSLPRGFYQCLTILFVLGFMALARIRRPEQLRHIAPGELGKVVGMDRVPEVKTLRAKITLMAEKGNPDAWMKHLSRLWMREDPEEAGYLYADGHVRVYHGKVANLPARHVSRERLCLRGTTDYWVNDALGRPFFVVSKPIPEGLGATLLEQIVPELLASVPNQPDEQALKKDALLHRFVVIFDREGATYSVLSALWHYRIAALTYRKNVKDRWPESEFKQVEVPTPGGDSTQMMLAERESTLDAGTQSILVKEVRRRTETGHQTAIITTGRTLPSLVIAGRMFARWCQENFFGYMMKHYDIDGLVQYGAQEISGTVKVINPQWRILDKAVKKSNRQLQKLYARLAQLDESTAPEQEVMFKRAQLMESIHEVKARRDTERAERWKLEKKVPIETLPEDQRPTQLLPLNKLLTDTVKMIAYRAETALVGLLIPHLNKEEEARALVRELLVSAADIIPDQDQNTLTVRIHRMACPAHDKAIEKLLEALNDAQFHHPQTGAKIIYTLA